MAAIDIAARALSQCWKCEGCNRLNDDTFRGDNKCLDFRRADAATLIERNGGKQNDEEVTEPNWRPK